MIKYLGSKRTIVPHILRLAKALDGIETVCDLFAGTTRVAQAFKRSGYRVHANDLASYSEVLARTYVEQDGAGVDQMELERKLEYLMALPPRDGYFTESFCRRSRFFQPKNGMRMDAMRGEIDAIASSPLEHATLLTSLMEAADRVDSTTGLQMAYLKQWAPRASLDLTLRPPALIPGDGAASRRDATTIAPELCDTDLVYLDPPYNQHSYFSNYHIWETLVRNDEPEMYGVACKRMDCRTEKSAFNSRPAALDALALTVRAIPAPHVMISFSDEGFIHRDAIEALLAERGQPVACVPIDHRRYVGAQIGVYNPAGRRVGKVSHLRNTELLFVSGPSVDAGAIARGMDASA